MEAFSFRDKTVQLKKLDNSFYTDHCHLVEALDNHNGSWEQGKVRGYGIVVIEINDLRFAIPLRTNIRHSACYITVTSSNPGVKGKGLDFSKALLITDDKYISNQVFKIDSSEHKRLLDKEHFIRQKFSKYVSKYVDAYKKADNNILSSFEYRFTTLCNYHAELGIS